MSLNAEKIVGVGVLKKVVKKSRVCKMQRLWTTARQIVIFFTLWVFVIWFSAEIIFALFKNAGFRNITIKKRQKYGLGNLLAWLNERKPRGDIKYDFISETIDAAYKAEMGKYNAEYLVLYAEK